MIVWGTLVTQMGDRIPMTTLGRASWAVSWVGVLLTLGVFMADAIRTLPGGPDAVRQVLPAAFNWPVFAAALLLMAMPLLHTGWRLFSNRQDASDCRRFDAVPSRHE